MQKANNAPFWIKYIHFNYELIMFVGVLQVVALGWCFGEKTYLKSSWNILDGMLVMISVIDILVSLISNSGTKILGMLRVLRLLRTLRPLRYWTQDHICNVYYYVKIVKLQLHLSLSRRFIILAYLHTCTFCIIHIKRYLFFTRIVINVTPGVLALLRQFSNR